MNLRPSLITAALAATALVPASASAAKVAPDVKQLKVTPAAFKALPAGGPVVTSGGALVTFQLFSGADVYFTFKSERNGRRSGGKCVAGKAKTKKAACKRTVAIPGGFTFVGITGPNELRLSGRLGDKALAPGTYRVVAKAEGTAPRSSYARFKIIK